MDTSLSSLYTLLRTKEEQLERLMRCQSELQQYQQAFFNDQHLCTNPELSSMTWSGMLANQFDNLRENGILLAYEEIENKQFQNVFQMINNKISDIQAEIRSIQETISALKLANLQS